MTGVTTPPVRTARPIGLVLVVPALLALLAGYVVPGARTLWTSFQRVSVLRDGDEFTGFDNYSRVAELGFFRGLGFALAIAVLPVLAACVLAPALAWLAHRAGTPGRLAVRLGLVLPMVIVTPAGLALAWRASTRGGALTEPLSAQLFVGLVVWLTLFGLLVGVGVTLFLAALRRGGTGRPVRAVAVTGLVTGLAVVAYTMQAWTYPAVLTGGGPDEATITPMQTVYDAGFRRLDLGVGAAGGTVLALLLGLLGLAAVAVLVAGRARVDVVGPRTGVRPTAPLPLAGALVLLAVVLAVAGYALWPWLFPEWDGAGPAPLEGVGSAFNTWVPPLVTTVDGVVLAAFAGFGIGALRPFGDRSELLLFVFAPWLFVGTGPFSMVHFQTLNDLDLIGTMPALLPPAHLSIPALVVFTLLFRGLAEARPGNPARTLLPALPMVAVVGGITYVTQTQDAYWQTITVFEPERMPLPAAAIAAGNAGAFGGAASLALPVAAVVLFALVLAALQVLYLDRLSIRTTPAAEPWPATPPGPGRPFGHPPVAGYPPPSGYQPPPGYQPVPGSPPPPGYPPVPGYQPPPGSSAPPGGAGSGTG
ncbi:hypothetical protein JCM9533A_35030 [Catenuloplanes niger JCM 9533]